jgi:hypothetical protein
MSRRDTGAPSDTTPSAPKPLAPGVLTEAVPLRDALEGIGELWRLPKKAPTLPGGMPAVASEGTRRTLPGGMSAVDEQAGASRNTQTTAMPAIPAPSATLRGVPLWVWGAGVAVTSALAWWTLQPPALTRDPMPAALRTTWRSSHPDYERAAMKFTDAQLTIMTVDPSASDPTRPIEMRHPISGLRSRVRGDTTDFTLTYDVEGDRVEMQARLVSGRTPTLIFVRPEGLTWYPESAGLAGTPP